MLQSMNKTLTTENIEKLNEEIKRCKKCRLSITRIHSLCGEGKLNTKILLVAQAPGEKEDKEGKMFIGPSGKVLDELLEKSKVRRQDVYMTNLIKCMLPEYRKPKPDEIDTCSQYLDKEIDLINPEILVPLGYYATKYIFEKNSGKNYLSSDFWGRLFYLNNKKIFPLKHPSSLLHNPLNRKKVSISYKKLRVFFEECKWYSVCPLKSFYEQEKLDRKWIELYCKGDWESCVRFQMEEKGQYHPDWMLPDGEIDKRLEEL